MPSGQMVRLKYGRIQTWFDSETNHPADEKKVLSETANVTGLNGSFESVCCFVFNFRGCLFTSLGVCLWNLDFILLTNESP